MSKNRKGRRAASKSMTLPSEMVLSKELKTTFWIALPVGAAAVLIVLWPKLFPVPPEQLVEVAWKHECSCATGWINSLRTEHFTVRDYEGVTLPPISVISSTVIFQRTPFIGSPASVRKQSGLSRWIRRSQVQMAFL